MTKVSNDIGTNTLLREHTLRQRVESLEGFLSWTIVVTRYHVPFRSRSVGAQIPLV